jgi:ribose 5-phosphate isomerase A
LTALQAAEVSGAETAKRRAAESAVALVESGMRLGLGTGSTARHVLDVIGERLRAGSLHDIVGIPTSRWTEEYARAAGIPVATLDDHEHLDLAIDGADEVDAALDLIKGLGGALLWEKIVAGAADRFVVVVDGSKLVDRLGRRAPLPVEVVPFGWRSHLAAMRAAGAEPSLRQRAGAPFVTDGGHYIIDCRFSDGLADPADVHGTLRARAGVVESGLFLGMATDVFVAAADGVDHLRRSAP